MAGAAGATHGAMGKGTKLLVAAAAALVAWGGSRAVYAESKGEDVEAARARTTARELLGQMETASEHARLALRRARSIHDVRAAACADEALTRADVSLRIGRDHEERASAAWAAGDRERARFEMRSLSARGEMVRAAAHDADGCFARPPSAATLLVAPFAPNDVTLVRMTVDPTLPGDVTGYP